MNQEIIIELCEKYRLKYITLIDNDDFDMEILCSDDNDYDVIINKQRIVEGIDIRRAHVIWIENKPNNNATTIQLIGRCRRNALLWRDDIDICLPKYRTLLQKTRISKVLLTCFSPKKNLHLIWIIFQIIKSFF